MLQNYINYRKPKIVWNNPHAGFLTAFAAAVIVHLLVAIVFYSYALGPKAYIVDNSTYRVALAQRILEPTPESIIEPLSASQESPKQEDLTPKSKPDPVVKPVEKPIVEPEPQKSTEAILESEPSKSSPVETIQTVAPSKKKIAKQSEASISDHSDKGEPANKVAESKAKEQPQQDQKEQKAPVKKIEEPKEQFRSPAYVLGSPSNPRPVYPSLARRRGWEGDVLLGVHVDVTGSVTYVEILESSNVSALDFAAYSTIYESWSFSPADAAEASLRGYVTVPISFRLD
ncbi:MAG: energy transducer TonB [Oleiphilaceae bacterium]|nr:energy transducer TonB [Oleiphilaceae bacterium]